MKMKCFLLSVFRFGYLRSVIKSYQRDGNQDWAYENLVSGNWARTFLIGKQKGTVTAFREHVSACLSLYKLYEHMCYLHRKAQALKS